MTSTMITGGRIMMQSGNMGVLVYRAWLHHDIPMLSDFLSLSLLPVYVTFPTGALGYFPSYTLGAMMAAQLYETAKKEIPDLEKKIEKV